MICISTRLNTYEESCKNCEANKTSISLCVKLYGLSRIRMEDE